MLEEMDAASAFLAFEAVFEFTGVAEGKRTALPGEMPGTIFGGPFGFAGVVLSEAKHDIGGETEIALPAVVAKFVDAIHGGTKNPVGEGPDRVKLGAGVGFEPTTFRL